MSERTRFPIRTAIIAAVATFSVLAGTIGSYAYWSATANANLGVGAATLTATATGWSSTTLGNENIVTTGGASLSSTGSVTITNTTSTSSSQSQTLSATFSAASGDSTLAAGTTATIWSVASAASCTASATPVSPQSGTWAAGVTVTRTLAPGAAAVYCIRNTINDRQDVAATSGTRTFVPQVAAQLSISNFTGNTTVTSSIATQYIYALTPINSAAWYYIKRSGTEWCWDVSGSGTTNGSLLISYGCKNNTDTNQDWRWIDADGDGYGNFQARHATGIRVGAATSTTSGSAVTMLTTNNASTQQQWQPQLVSSGVYQFVNEYSGLCLSAPASSAAVMTQVTCTGGADQRFTFTKRETIALTSFTCTNTGGSTTGRTVQFAWTADYSGDSYTIQARRTAATAWVDIVSSTGTSATFPTPYGSPWTTWGNGTYSVQIINSAGEVVGSDTVTIARQGTSYYYGRC